MRPTLLNFRAPREKTPDYYDKHVTHHGGALNFQTKILNKKNISMSQEKRFTHYQMFHRGSGVTRFLGPGSYNDHENYSKLTQRPCSSVMKQLTSIPREEGGKPYYIMVGQNLTYEPGFVSNPDQAKDLQDLQVKNSRINLRAGMENKSISRVRQKLNKSVEAIPREHRNYTHGFSYTNPCTDSTQLPSTNHNDPAQSINLSSSQAIMQPSTSGIQRPQTCNNCYKQTPTGRNNTFATKDSSVKIGNDYDITPYQGAQRSINQNSNTSHFKQSKDMQSPHDKNDFLDLRVRDLTKEMQMHLKNSLPKSANHYYQMKKGFNPKGVRDFSISSKDEEFKKPLPAMQAYGDMIPNLAAFRKHYQRSKSRPNKSAIRGDNRLDFNESNTYMNVIKDSPAVIYQREFLGKEKNKILNMDFKRPRKNGTQRINQYLAQKFTGYSTSSPESNPFK